jgi:hypothetical protein
MRRGGVQGRGRGGGGLVGANQQRGIKYFPSSRYTWPQPCWSCPPESTIHRMAASPSFWSKFLTAMPRMKYALVWGNWHLHLILRSSGHAIENQETWVVSIGADICILDQNAAAVCMSIWGSVCFAATYPEILLGPAWAFRAPGSS